MKVWILILFFIPSLSAADNIKWKVLETTFTMETLNFQITEFTVYMTCFFEDGSGGFSKTPYKELTFTLEEQPHEGSYSHFYQIHAQKDQLKARALFSELRSCSYRIKMATDFIDEISGEPMRDTKALISSGNINSKNDREAFLNRNIAQEISLKYSPSQPLRLKAYYWGIGAPEE